MVASVRNGETEATDLHEQVGNLRAQLEALVERSSPVVADAVRQAGNAAREQVDALSGRVRAEPIAAVLIAAAAGYIFGRLSR